METSARLGPYRLDELTGEGAVAQVYKAWHTELHRFEALKLLRDSMTHEATIVARFLSEARTAAQLRHPNIATIYSVGDGDGGQPYFTMELIEGSDLGEYLRVHAPMPLADAVPLLRQIADAIDYAHTMGVIHRDIKPANILLEETASGVYQVKLVDFGIARVQTEEAASRLTQAGGVFGTPKYISPEQASEQEIDYRTDIYSFGVVAYEMLCGRTPFNGAEPATTVALLMAHVHTMPSPPRDLAPTLSQAANDALLRCLAKSPDERFQSCGDFVQALTAPPVARQTPAPVSKPAAVAPSTQISDAAAPPKRTNAAKIGATLGVLALAAVAGSRFLPHSQPASPSPTTTHATAPAAAPSKPAEPATLAPIQETVVPLKPLAQPPKPASPAAKAAILASKTTPHPALTHPAPHRITAARLKSRRRPAPVKRAHSSAAKHGDLAAAWESSYRQEMALSQSYRKKGDAVQAAALAQNAEDSRRHALEASGTPKHKARRGHR